MESRPDISEKQFQKARRLYRSFNEMGDNGPELFDDAESNMNMDFNKAELDFPDNLDGIDEDLKELRKNTDTDNIISESLMQSALNIYIENAMILAKKNNMVDVGNWDDLGESFDDIEGRRDRELLETNLTKLNKLGKESQSSDFENRHARDILNDDSMKVERDKGLLELAEQGKLFDIKMDNVYKSVGKLQVKNFERYYGVKT